MEKGMMSLLTVNIAFVFDIGKDHTLRKYQARKEKCWPVGQRKGVSLAPRPSTPGCQPGNNSRSPTETKRETQAAS